LPLPPLTFGRLGPGGGGGGGGGGIAAVRGRFKLMLKSERCRWDINFGSQSIDSQCSPSIKDLFVHQA